MMDLKEIIKWFIPCFHVLVTGRLPRMDSQMIFVSLFLLFNLCSVYTATVNTSEFILGNSLINNTKKLEVGFSNFSYLNRYSDNEGTFDRNLDFEESTEVEDGSVGRTFGRPLKKMVQALVPLAFQMGMAATWAVVAALVGIKTLGVTLLILKLLLLAGAFKIGSLFGHKAHGQGWEQSHPQNKEIHLHIHNGQHGTEEHIPISSWSREGQNADAKPINAIYDSYANGPQTVSTPYGHYMKIDPQQQNIV